MYDTFIWLSYCCITILLAYNFSKYYEDYANRFRQQKCDNFDITDLIKILLVSFLGNVYYSTYIFF